MGWNKKLAREKYVSKLKNNNIDDNNNYKIYNNDIYINESVIFETP